MDELKNKLKEKIQNYTSFLKGAGLNLWEKSAPFYQKILANQKRILAGLLAGAVLVGVGAGSFYLLQWWKYRNESPAFHALRKAELAATGQVGSKVTMGNLEITLLDAMEGTYHPLEVDENFKRIPPRGYFGARIMIFNTGYSEKEFLLFGLTDDLGNQYERDREIDFYAEGVRDFGPAKEIYPRTIRGGDIGDEKTYLLFPTVDPSAKKLQLTVMSETQNKKAIFDIER